MRAAVIVFPGSNCDRDLAVAFERVTGRPTEMVWHKDSTLPSGLDVVAVPGGFSFGDYLRCGAIAARSPIMRSVVEFANNGGHVLGICNGFQVLIESGLLPGALMRNAGLKFVCKDVELSVTTTKSPFTNKYRKGEKIRIPVAHHDGNYVAGDDLVAQLRDEDRIAFTYEGAQACCLPVAINAGLFWPRRSFLKRPGTAVIEFLPVIPAGLPRDVFHARMRESIEGASRALMAEAVEADPRLASAFPEGAVPAA